MTQQLSSSVTSVKRIIIVEDDLQVRETVVKFLSLAGYEITGVGSAREFYQKLSEEEYALAILDIGLPDQDGFILAEYVRKNTDMWIIMLTGRPALEDKLTGYNAGADYYMVKPISCRELGAAIANLFKRLEKITTETKVELVAEAPVSESALSSWTILSNEWVLLTPAGDTIKLTSKEFDFLMILLQQHKIVVNRQEILKALAYCVDEFGNRALESMVYRLRSKIDALHFDFPVKTSHGIGYCFVADIVII